MFKLLLNILFVDDVALLISWTFALYIVIGATVEFNYREVKKGALLLLVFVLSYISIGSEIYNYLLIRREDSIRILVTLIPAVILVIAFLGILSGKFLDRLLVKKGISLP